MTAGEILPMYHEVNEVVGNYFLSSHTQMCSVTRFYQTAIPSVSSARFNKFTLHERTRHCRSSCSVAGLFDAQILGRPVDVVIQPAAAAVKSVLPLCRTSSTIVVGLVRWRIELVDVPSAGGCSCHQRSTAVESRCDRRRRRKKRHLLRRPTFDYRASRRSTLCLVRATYRSRCRPHRRARRSAAFRWRHAPSSASG